MVVSHFAYTFTMPFSTHLNEQTKQVIHLQALNAQ